MARFEEIARQLRTWNVRWRWEGNSGHPRRLTDALTQMMDERGYTVDVAEDDIRAEPLANVAEFAGVAIGLKEEPQSEALRRKRAYLVAGIVLLPVVVGIFLIRYALNRWQYNIGLEWRGEMYSAAERAEATSAGAERANIVSDVRLTLRSRTFEGSQALDDPQVIRADLDLLYGMVVAQLPQLALHSGHGSSTEQS